MSVLAHLSDIADNHVTVTCDRGSSHAGLLIEYVIHKLKGHHKVTRIETSESGFSPLRICWTFSGKLLCRNFTS